MSTKQPSVRPDASTSPKSGIPIDQPAKSVTEPSAFDQPDHGKGASSLGTTPKTDTVDLKKPDTVYPKDFPKGGVTEAAAKGASGTFDAATLQGNDEARRAQKAQESALYAAHQAGPVSGGMSPAQYADAHQDQFPHADSPLDNTVPNSLNTAHQQGQVTGLQGVDLTNALRNAGVGSAHDAIRDPISQAGLVDWMRVPDADAYEFSVNGHHYRASGHEIAMLGLQPNQVAMVVRWLQTNRPIVRQ